MRRVALHALAITTTIVLLTVTDVAAVPVTTVSFSLADVLFPSTGLLPRYFNHAGRMEADSKCLHHQLGYNDEKDFKVRYGHNLFGDPATGLWTPRAMPGCWKPMAAQGAEAPMRLELLACKPNPASGQTTLMFALNRSADVKVGLYDISGRLVEVMYEGAAAQGTTVRSWDPGGVAPGVYMVRVQADGLHAGSKLVVLR